MLRRCSNLKLPLLLPGMSIDTSPTDYFMFKQAQLQRFDGTQWRLFGELISTDTRCALWLNKRDGSQAASVSADFVTGGEGPKRCYVD